MTEVEPEWDDSDRAWAIALMELHADTCSGCRQPLSETTHPDAEGAYEVPAPTRCHSCTALHSHQESAGDKYSTPSALLFETLRRR